MCRHVDPFVLQITERFFRQKEDLGKVPFSLIFHLAQQKVGHSQQLLADIREEVCDLCRTGKELHSDLIFSTTIKEMYMF